MKKVKIISGTYGYRRGRCIKPKDRNSEPFELSDDEAHRLVSLGIAEIVNTAVATPDNGSYTQPPSDNPPEGVNGGNGEYDETDGKDNPPTEAELYKMTNAALKEMAEDMRVDTSKFKVKREFIKAIMESSTDDIPPDVSTEDPIV